ncbi:hypothetical protein [Glutamicibacter sp.]|uniref:hypothetical protein n=1 Tax=Glutamicibacter sp. TaxID=1931995 RepID=UPI0028BF459E|nr:hypothetical protein [Glutamicibacter sp.]
MSTENPKVIWLGEDTELFIVTGTTDAHSADEAVRQSVEGAVGGTIEHLLDADDLIEFKFNHRADWAWKPGPNLEDPMDGATLVHGENGAGLPRFAGFLVQA